MAAAREALDRLPTKYLSPERAESLIEISRFYYLNSQCELAIQAVSAAVQVATNGGHRSVEGRSRTAHATCLRENCDYLASLREFACALEIFRAEGDAVREAKVLNNLGNWYCEVGLNAEALAIFERIATYFHTTGDSLSRQMALDNAAIAALRLGNLERGIAFAERAAEIWPGEAKTSRDFLLVVQGAEPYCELLIQADRLDEAAACARLARVAANKSGLAQARMLADIADAISGYSLGIVGGQAIEFVIAQAEGESPALHLAALEAAIRVYEHAGQFDRALLLQHDMLALNRKRRFDEVRRALGEPSPKEAEGTEKLARLGAKVESKVGDLTRVAIDQALRTGFDAAKVFRVSRLAQSFAAHDGLPKEKVYQIGLAGKLIDIGMIILPDDLVLKPRELTAGERRLVEKHAEFGADLLSNARLALLQPCVPLVRFHHERWDGAGPCALSGDAIPYEARVVSLCDAFEALRHDRPWRDAFSITEALRIISEAGGTQFDPKLAVRFVAWLQDQYRSTVDFEDRLVAEALEDDYVRMRERISRLMGGGNSARGPRTK